MQERLIERKLYNAVKDKGGLCIKLLALHFAGLPDRLVLLPEAKMFFAELKTTGERPRKLQLKVHEMIRKLGFKVYVIDSIQQITDIFYDKEV